MTIYDPLKIDPTFGSETRDLSVKNTSKLRFFESNTVRRIYGLAFTENLWRTPSNGEIEDTPDREDIVRFIKTQRLCWMRGVKRMVVDVCQRRFIEK